MPHFIFNTDDTIVALSTPQGVSAIAVIRLSGKESIHIAQHIFQSKNLHQAASHTLHFGKIIFKDEWIDEAVIGIFKAPHTYTGQNIIEISCHGSPYIIDKIIEACIAYGARLAKPGEFTQRAFLNGKLDLTQAEAVADLIHAENKASKESALKNMRGGFSQKLKTIKNQLIEFAALIELELDFADEDVEFADRSKFLHLVNNIQQELMLLSQSFKWGNALKKGIQIAIIGKPNAGKSTLLNAILNEERAIVSTIAGTTRDTIEESFTYKDVRFKFIDTAGIRKSTDEIEQIGVQKSLQKMNEADMILYVFDSTEMSVCELIEQEDYFKNLNKTYLLVANKMDKINKADMEQKFKAIPFYLSIAAQQKQGITNILDYIQTHFQQHAPVKEDVIITNLRHYEALQKILQNLSLIQQGLQDNLSGDLLSVEIKHCLHHIGELTGEITNEDILDYVFKNFCIGK